MREGSWHFNLLQMMMSMIWKKIVNKNMIMKENGNILKG